MCYISHTYELSTCICKSNLINPGTVKQTITYLDIVLLSMTKFLFERLSVSIDNVFHIIRYVPLVIYNTNNVMGL